MSNESTVNVPNTGTAPVRVIQVTTLIDGVPTVVDMQIVSVADRDGVVFDSLFDRQQRRLLEDDSIRSGDAARGSFARRYYERTTLTDRRGPDRRGTR